MADSDEQSHWSFRAGRSARQCWAGRLSRSGVPVGSAVSGPSKGWNAGKGNASPVCRATSADLMSSCVPAAEGGGLVSASEAEWYVAVLRLRGSQWGSSGVFVELETQRFRTRDFCKRSVATGRRRLGAFIASPYGLSAGNGGVEVATYGL